MLSFLFGKKRKTRRRSVKRKGSRKLPARLIKRCKKYRIKCTKKVGGRRVYKKISVIRKLISNKLKKRRLPSNTYSGSLRNRKKVRKTRRTRFGTNEVNKILDLQEMANSLIIENGGMQNLVGNEKFKGIVKDIITKMDNYYTNNDPNADKTKINNYIAIYKFVNGTTRDDPSILKFKSTVQDKIPF